MRRRRPFTSGRFRPMCRWYAGGASSVELRDLQDVDNNAARLDRSERLPWHGRTAPWNDLQVKIRVAPSTVKLKRMSLPVQEGPILTICMVVVSWCRYDTTNFSDSRRKVDVCHALSQCTVRPKPLACATVQLPRDLKRPFGCISNSMAAYGRWVRGVRNMRQYHLLVAWNLPSPASFRDNPQRDLEHHHVQAP